MSALVVGCCAAAVVLLMAAVALAARRTGRWAVVDVVWGPGFLLVALVAALVGNGDLARRLLFLVLVAVWSLRLASHILRRSRGAGEDPRYEEIKKRGGLFGKVLLPQGVAMWFVSLPLQVTSTSRASLGVVAWIGVLVWAVGLVFESVGDAQLTAYKADPDRGTVMDRGLWRYTRHPNYFGDACVWWGIWLVAADAGWPGIATVLSPVAMTFFLAFATGARLLERTMMQRPGYPEYAARTSMFVPLPPKRSVGS